MFGSSKPVVLESYGSRRKRGRPPRWLVLLLSGIAVGAAGVVLLQERYLPPRLSAADTAKLRADYETADGDRTRLQQSLNDTSTKLQAALAEKKTLTDELAASRSTTDELRADLAAVVEALPPDPRGGSIEVRAARIAVQGNALVYDVVLSRGGRGAKPMPAVMQLIAAGTSAKGGDSTVSLKPVSFQIGSQEVLRGNQPLPEGFRPREATIQLLDRAGGRALGMRVMIVK